MNYLLVYFLHEDMMQMSLSERDSLACPDIGRCPPGHRENVLPGADLKEVNALVLVESFNYLSLSFGLL
jgi:hypothetical protein